MYTLQHSWDSPIGCELSKKKKKRKKKKTSKQNKTKKKDEVFESQILVHKQTKNKQTIQDEVFKFQILVHKYWTIINRFCVPLLWASG